VSEQCEKTEDEIEEERDRESVEYMCKGSTPEWQAMLWDRFDKYRKVQRWRKESGSKERFKGRSLHEEYLAQVSDDKRKYIEDQQAKDDEEGVVSPDAVTIAMVKDCWLLRPYIM